MAVMLLAGEDIVRHQHAPQSMLHCQDALPGCIAMWRQEEDIHSSTVPDLQTCWVYERTMDLM